MRHYVFFMIHKLAVQKSIINEGGLKKQVLLLC
jgi:hypothetical protein